MKRIAILFGALTVLALALTVMPLKSVPTNISYDQIQTDSSHVYMASAPTSGMTATSVAVGDTWVEVAQVARTTFVEMTEPDRGAAFAAYLAKLFKQPPNRVVSGDCQRKQGPTPPPILLEAL